LTFEVSTFEMLHLLQPFGVEWKQLSFDSIVTIFFNYMFVLSFELLNIYNTYYFVMIVFFFVINCNITMSFPIY